MSRWTCCRRLVDEIGGVGGAIGDALGGADSILGDLGDGFSVWVMGWKRPSTTSRTASRIFPSVIDQLVSDIEAEFDPLTQAAEDLGTTWGGVFEGSPRGLTICPVDLRALAAVYAACWIG
ncbi:MAG: hypothetical protein IPK53_03810 [bacterium]|nr:hypothetical protein [bacterium]